MSTRIYREPLVLLQLFVHVLFRHILTSQQLTGKLHNKVFSLRAVLYAYQCNWHLYNGFNPVEGFKKTLIVLLYKPSQAVLGRVFFAVIMGKADEWHGI